MTDAPEGLPMIRQAEAWMRGEAIADPEAMIRMAAPGLALRDAR
jgi:hypothetical protein